MSIGGESPQIASLIDTRKHHNLHHRQANSFIQFQRRVLRMRNRVFNIFSVTVVLLLVFTLGGVSRAAAQGGAPIYAEDSTTAIQGQYIVVFKEGTGPGRKSAAIEAARARGAEVMYVYDAALNGFAAKLPTQALNGLARNPNVAYIEADQIMSVSGAQSPTPSWGLDRIDQRNLPLDNTYNYEYTGAGVTAYIIDTGIRITHTDFGGRASYGWDAVGNDADANDCNGHGTHVAGTVGGSSYGVAKGVSLVAVRVLNCAGSGSTSGVIAGINWVTNDHGSGESAVANMSLGGGASSALDAAVNGSISDGVVYSVSAGNSSANACNYSPARVGAAITVGATTSTDARASYSNTGTCLDIFAPGSSITSAWKNSNTAKKTISGTSMASPHVAGVAALYLQNHPGSSPAAVRNAIVGAASTGKVTNPGSGSPNLLLYSLVP
jgi:subtilisin family serine protease